MSEKFETWQIWRGLRKCLKDKFLMKAFGKRNARTISGYAENPRETQGRGNDLLENLHTVFSEADIRGRGDLARAAIAYLETSLEPEYLPSVNKPLPTIQEEILADYSAVSELQVSISRGDDTDVVNEYKQAAIDEIERTYSKYLEDFKKGHE